LFDSSAIAIYLVEKYAKDDSLYPKDIQKRAKVNEKIFYCSSTIFPTGFQIFYPVIFGTATETDPAVLKKFERIVETIESFFNDGEYVTGDTMTLADIFLWSILESGTRVIPLDVEKSKNTIRFLEKMRQLPSNEFMQQGAEMHISFYNKCLERNKAMKK
jgi:glutathione S-transferase